MRVYLPKRAQKKLIKEILSNVSIKEAATACRLSERTIRDWRRGKFLIDFKCLKILCKKTGLKIPKNITLKENYWYVTKGSSKGGLAVFKKYGRICGDPEYREKKWREWWEKEGKYKKHPIINTIKSIKKPYFSKELAEFAGIVLGDGGISPYQVVVSLNHQTESKYANFVVGLIKKLFAVPVGTHCDKTEATSYLVVSRRNLVLFCTKKLELKQGNKIKQQIDIPRWIKKNKQYAIACVRGLIDTDGCVFDHRYKSKGKWYSYKKICFTSYSEPLRRSVFAILKNNGLNPRFAQIKDVRLDSKKDIQRYFQIFNSHNSYLLKRLLK